MPVWLVWDIETWDICLFLSAIGMLSDKTDGNDGEWDRGHWDIRDFFVCVICRWFDSDKVEMDD